MNKKTNEGITLIALVITIIVLLILAAVSLNLVAGGDGILGRATTAVNNTNTAKIAEEIELAMAQLKTDYYEARYVTRNTEFTEFAPYAVNSLNNGITTANGGTLKLVGSKITYTNNSEEASGDFEVNDDGSITILGIKIEGEAGKTTPTFASQIEVANYGEYVNLGTELLPTTDGVINQKLGGAEPTEQPLTDWRIFHKDTDGGIYLILADYLPYEHNETLETGLINEGETYPYNWKGESGTKLIQILNDENAWNGLIDSKYTTKGITVKGAIGVEEWVASWNANAGKEELFTQYTEDTETYSAKGWLVGTEQNPTTYSVVSLNNSNTLYFPHTSALSNNYGYSLASTSAYGSHLPILVNGVGALAQSSNYANYGVRPTVYIPAGISAEKNAQGIWELDI